MLDSPTDDNKEISDKEITQDKQIAEESSTSDNLDVQNTEDSSTSEESKLETTLDAVNAALKEDSGDDDTEGSSEDDKADDKDKPEGKSESDDKSDDDITDEELALMKGKTRKRFEQLQSRFREKTKEFTELKNKYESSEVDANHYRNFTKFLDNNNINQEEANMLFDIGALMKNDPNKALQALTPYYNQLLEATGNVLPADLKQQVEQGYITEENAVEFSRQRAANQQYKVREQNQVQQQQRQQTQRQQELNVSIQGALAGLEKNWQSSDPDYKMKSARIQERVKLMWFEASKAGTMPKSVDEAVKMAEKVKREVEQEIKQFVPARKTVNAPIDGGNVSSAKPTPRSTLDVINQTVGS